MIDTILSILFWALTAIIDITIIVVGIKQNWGAAKIVISAIIVPVVLTALFAFVSVIFAIIGVVAIGIAIFIIRNKVAQKQ